MTHDGTTIDFSAKWTQIASDWNRGWWYSFDFTILALQRGPAILWGMPKKPAKKTTNPKTAKGTKRQPKEDFNQAAFRAVQEVIKRGEA